MVNIIWLFLGFQPEETSKHSFPWAIRMTYLPVWNGLREMGLDALIFVFWVLSFKPNFYSPLSPLSNSVGKASAYYVEDLGWIPGLESSPGEGNGNPLQYCCLENPMDRELWQATVHGIAIVRYDLVLSFFISKRFFSSSSLSAIRVVSSAYLRLLIFLPAILIPASASSSPAFLLMYSAYKLNKQGDNIQSWWTPYSQSRKPHKSKFLCYVISQLIPIANKLKF